MIDITSFWFMDKYALPEKKTWQVGKINVICIPVINFIDDLFGGYMFINTMYLINR